MYRVVLVLLNKTFIKDLKTDKICFYIKRCNTFILKENKNNIKQCFNKCLEKKNNLKYLYNLSEPVYS